VGEAPLIELGREPVGGAEGERRPGADDDDPDECVRESGRTDRLAGLRAAVDPHQRGHDHATEQARRETRQLHQEPVSVRDGRVDEERDDGGNRDQGPQDPELADLAVRPEVALED
jgi:hypothetical protein